MEVDNYLIEGKVDILDLEDTVLEEMGGILIILVVLAVLVVLVVLMTLEYNLGKDLIMEDIHQIKECMVE
jgi:hypothetical protein